MSYKDMARRLAAMESGTDGTDAAVAVRRDYEDEVTVCGTNERMPLAEWRERNPHGTLINVRHGRRGAERGAT